MIPSKCIYYIDVLWCIMMCYVLCDIDVNSIFNGLRANQTKILTDNDPDVTRVIARSRYIMLQSFAKGDTLTSYHASISGQSGKLKEMPRWIFTDLKETCNCNQLQSCKASVLHTPTHSYTLLHMMHAHIIIQLHQLRGVALRYFVVDCVRLRCVLRILGISVTHTHTHQKNTDTVLNCVGPMI